MRIQEDCVWNEYAKKCTYAKLCGMKCFAYMKYYAQKNGDQPLKENIENRQGKIMQSIETWIRICENAINEDRTISKKGVAELLNSLININKKVDQLKEKNDQLLKDLICLEMLDDGE